MLRFALAAIAFAAVVVPAAAQTDAAAATNFPNRPIRIIVPFPPGGPTDLIARFVGQRMSEHWGQPVVIENRAGANTAIGAQMVEIGTRRIDVAGRDGHHHGAEPD